MPSEKGMFKKINLVKIAGNSIKYRDKWIHAFSMDMNTI